MSEVLSTNTNLFHLERVELALRVDRVELEF